jgi:hypothetical protein
VGRLHATSVALEKQYVLHILSVFETLFIQHAIRLGHIVIHGLQCSSFSHKRHDFGKKFNEHELCVLRLYTTLSEIFFTLSRI